MEEEKDLFSQIIWEILTVNLTMMLSTVNTLTYIFTLSSLILFFPIYKDLKKYKSSKTFNKKRNSFCLSLAVISLASFAILVALVITSSQKLEFSTQLTYALYGTTAPILFVTLVLALKDYITNRKAKLQNKNEKKEEEKIDFVVEEMGTSVDRENIKNQAEQEETKVNVEQNLNEPEESKSEEEKNN